MKPLLMAILSASPSAAFDFPGLSGLFGNLSSILFPGATANRGKSIAPSKGEVIKVAEDTLAPADAGILDSLRCEPGKFKALVDRFNATAASGR